MFLDSLDRSHPLVRACRGAHQWIAPVLDGRRILASPGGYTRFFRTRRAYAKLPGAEVLKWRASYPCIGDNVATTPFDAHYFYQSVWAADLVRQRQPQWHLDVGSRIEYVASLTMLTEVVFLDYRPLPVTLPRFQSLGGTILALPFDDRSVPSLSCLHVAEHIGLGRYGDPLDPSGTARAAGELARVLAVGGVLYFSTPVGRPRVCFNAHRIHQPQQVLNMFSTLRMTGFAAVDDQRRFLPTAHPGDFNGADYALGMFSFIKD